MFTFAEYPLDIAYYRKRNFKMTELLLRKGANPNNHFRTFLSCELQNIRQTQNYDFLLLFLKYGAKEGGVLHKAACTNSCKLLTILLEHGGNPNENLGFGTPFDCAVRKQLDLRYCGDQVVATPAMNLLLSAGSDMKFSSENHWGALPHAISSNDLEMVKFLMQQGGLQILRTRIPNNRYNKIHCLPESGAYQIVKEFGTIITGGAACLELRNHYLYEAFNKIGATDPGKYSYQPYSPCSDWESPLEEHLEEDLEVPKRIPRIPKYRSNRSKKRK